MKTKELFNYGWEFAKIHGVAPYYAIDSIKDLWMKVDLPHDWQIFNADDLYEVSTGFYRKNLVVTSEELDANGQIILTFEGVYMNSEIWVNDKRVKRWRYGYSSFDVNVSKYVHAGNNKLVVVVYNEGPNTRWYSGSGIYRNVWRYAAPNRHIVHNSIYAVLRKDKEDPKLWNIKCQLDLSMKGRKRTVRLSLTDAQTGKQFFVQEMYGASRLELETTVKDPKIWDIESPNLYTLKAELLSEQGEVCDTEMCTVGFRTAEFTADHGFFLNGRHVKLNGMCMHHDLGCLGAAMNKDALRRQFENLKQMGVNAIRTSHNMPAVELMELADEMGFLIDSESFDMWEEAKTPYDNHRFFPKTCELDVESWVTRDRNHPSLILWSIGNEIHDTHTPKGVEITNRLKSAVERFDPEHNAHVTIGSNYMPWEGAQNCADIVKYAGYNYSESYYKEHHEAHPDWLIYGSETGSIVTSRGIYHFPYEQIILCDDDLQCSSLGNSVTSWGAKSTEFCVLTERDCEFSAGQFVWTGFDYIGEPTPYSSRNSFFGQIDTAGFWKDAAFIYKAGWTDYHTDPFVHVFPYWDFNEGQRIDIRVSSNAPAVELFLNDRSLGKKKIDHKKGKVLAPVFQAIYEPGSLVAVAYDEKGNEIAREEKHSFEDAKKLVLKPSKTSLKADGRSLSFIEISAEDRYGRPVENANNRVIVTVSGAGRLVGLDNGDSTDLDQYKGFTKRLFAGKLLAVVASDIAAGEIKVTVESAGLKSAELTMEAVACQKSERPARAVFAGSDECRNYELPDRLIDEEKTVSVKDEIPVRKIEIVSVAGKDAFSKTHGVVFDKKHPDREFKAACKPKASSYSKVYWRAVNQSGVDTNLAEIEVLSRDGSHIRVHAKGDGDFRLRAMINNDKDHAEIISVLECHVKGLGAAVLNPYEFVYGAIGDVKIGDSAIGIERGFSTSSLYRSFTGFRNVDFGEIGSDEFTLPVYELGGNVLKLEIWDGTPDEDGICLKRMNYQMPPIWNSYQPMTYKLDQRLRGVHNIFIGADHEGLNIQGFVFKKYEKAREDLKALSYSSVYGDAFTVTEDAIEGIGNNVSIQFDDMNFGEEGCKGISIVGRCKKANSIHVRFLDGTEEIKQVIEFPDTKGKYKKMDFPLEAVLGKKNVSFVFLPGCEFDFKSFQFLF